MLHGGDNKGYDFSAFCKKWEIKKKTIFQYTKKVKDFFFFFFLGVRHGKHSNWITSEGIHSMQWNILCKGFWPLRKYVDDFPLHTEKCQHRCK